MKKLFVLMFTLFFGFLGFGFCDSLTIQDPEYCVLYTGSIDGEGRVVFQDWNESKAGSYFLGGLYNLSQGSADSSIFNTYRGESSLDMYDESYYYYVGILFPPEGCSFSQGIGNSLTIQDPEYCVLYTGSIDGEGRVVFQDWNESKAGSYFLGGLYNLSQGSADSSIFNTYRGESSLDMYDESYYYSVGILFPPEGCSFSQGTGISFPKFVVNYGNTSYEYELDSDLSIYLKSPVIQSGNTFSYVGSTGLNLFYNNTSQRYNKSNLYLDSMFWYNKNIFTPICL